ncbi:hypothetical protein KI387_042882, partial [Taxus chinensis]
KRGSTDHQFPKYVTYLERKSVRSKSEAEIPPDSALLTLEMVDRFMALSLPVGSTKDDLII